MPEEHALLSASGAKKWLNCPGSVRLEKDVEEQPSPYAKEGTDAHALCEAKLRLLKKEYTKAKMHKQIKEIPVTDEMERYTNDYRDFVQERLSEAQKRTKDAKLLVEERLDYSEYAPEGFGTGDALILADQSIEVIDFKYGRGVKVDAEENPQLMLYGLGAIAEYRDLYDISTVRMTIFQPRLDHISSWETSAEDLTLWGEQYVKPRAEKAFAGTDACICGKHCEEGFCKARAFCRAYAEQKQALARYDFAAPATLTTDEIAEILEQSKNLSNWAELVRGYALTQAVNEGVSYPGFKLVEGRSSRRWAKPEAEIAELLAQNGQPFDEVYPRKLESLSKLETKLGKDVFAKLLGDCILKPPGTATLVPVEDSRKAMGSKESAAEDFKEYIGGISNEPSC